MAGRAVTPGPSGSLFLVDCSFYEGQLAAEETVLSVPAIAGHGRHGAATIRVLGEAPD